MFLYEVLSENMRKERITICIDKDVLTKIDTLKDYVSRSAYINHLLTVFLKYKNEGDARNELNKLLQK